jgi:hypothetical protein
MVASTRMPSGLRSPRKGGGEAGVGDDCCDWGTSPLRLRVASRLVAEALSEAWWKNWSSWTAASEVSLSETVLVLRRARAD